MSLEELYQWMRQIKQIFAGLGYWQMVGLALYSDGIVLAEHCAASRVAEKLVQVGKVSSVLKRLERWLHNERIHWAECCRAWSRFVLQHYVGERVMLITNAPDISARTYAKRYWQEAAFRDLKSDGWQWHTSHAFVLSLGTLAFEEPGLARVVLDKGCSVFRNGLRLWQCGLSEIEALLNYFTQTFFVFLDPPSLKCVRC